MYLEHNYKLRTAETRQMDEEVPLNLVQKGPSHSKRKLIFQDNTPRKKKLKKQISGQKRSIKKHKIICRLKSIVQQLKQTRYDRNL